jgi:hypothetical protein
MQEAINLSIAEEYMLFWINMYGILQMEGNSSQDIALKNFRTWNTVFITLSEV